MKKKTELLAPAGNMACLRAAVQSGADAVYFAGQSFGARSYAENFDEDAIFRAVEYCHLYSAAAYVTVNTTVFDRELDRLEQFVHMIAKAGVDGVIVQDPGVVWTIRTICPELPLHGSTQMTVHNLAGVRTAEQMGMKRIVLSRELTFSEIQYILQHCRAEIEIFVHGAMCMSYSGQCLMSSVLGGRSGNRGKCAQPCRLAYGGRDGERYYLSLKDMSLIEHSRMLADSGIASLKIEGRMKGPAYVAAVVGIYRKCLDQERGATPEELSQLNRVFYRGGLTDGYFTGQTGREMFAFDKPDNPYARMEGESVEPKEERQLGLSAEVSIQAGQPVSISIWYKDFVVQTKGEVLAEPARQRCLTEEEIRRQLTKTGGTPFVFQKMQIAIQDGVFLPVRELNAVRRQALSDVEARILSAYPRWDCRAYPQQPMEKKQRFLGYTCAVRTEEQFWTAAEFDFSYLYLPVDVLARAPERFQKEAERIVIQPPAIQKETEWQAFEAELDRLHALGFCRLLVENTSHLQYSGRFILYGGHRLNLTNVRALEEYKDAGLTAACLSPELNLAQIRDMEKCLPTEILVYGHLPLMVTENCILQNTGQCPGNKEGKGCERTAACPSAGRGGGKLSDRKGISFPVVRDGSACRSVVLNSLPTYMGDKKEELKTAGAAYQRLWFTIETAEECRKICGDYLLGIPCGMEKYTRLHFYKGVR